MEGLLRAQRGIFKTLAGSIIFHAVIISAGLFLFEAGSKRDFFTPVYTVEIIAPSSVSGPASTPEAAETPVAEAIEEKGPAKEEKKAEAKTEKVRVKESASVSEALKKVEERVRKKTEEASVSSRIEEIKKRQEERARETGSRLSELRKELGSKVDKAGPAPSANDSKSIAKSAKGPASGAATSTGGGNLKSRYPAYYSIIHDRIKDNWLYPEGFDYKKISVIVSIKIDRSGSLLESVLEESSGNKRFDESLMNAIQKASPFPPLPHEFEGKYLETGLRFCPGCPE